jgi:hypothetical protein
LCITRWVKPSAKAVVQEKAGKKSGQVVKTKSAKKTGHSPKAIHRKK